MKVAQVVRGSFLAVLAILLPAVALPQPAPRPERAGQEARPPFRGASLAERRGLFEQWKASRGRPDPLQAVPETIHAVLATSTVGRPSMAINASGQVLFTKQFPPASCDVDLGQCGPPSGSSCSTWLTQFAFPLGKIVRPATGNSYSVLYLAQNAGTTGISEPNWPITAGQTVVDGGITWLSIGFDPAIFGGCTATQLILRSNAGVETIIAQEGQSIPGGRQVAGWGEFYALNDNGVAAFKAPLAGMLDEDDEASVGLMIAGPGAGALSVIAETNTVIGGVKIFGISPMVAINNAGQVVFDGYSQDFNPGETTWAASTAYPANRYVLPTVPTQLEFTAFSGCTSGIVEPNWPTRPNISIADGGCSWFGRLIDGDENKHNLFRYTPGLGNQFLFGTGTNVGGATVTQFGPTVSTYDNIDGFLNASGHTSTGVKLSNGDTAVYLVTDPGAFTQVARTNQIALGGFFGTVQARTALNDSDQVLFKATVVSTVTTDKLVRWTAPSTFVPVASSGDDIGLRSGGAASGVTILALGYFADLNNPGNAVFQATLSTGPRALFFWDSATGLLTEIARDGPAFPAQLVSEMVTLNDTNVVAFTSGNAAPESADEASEMDMKGLHLWTKSGGVQHMIRVGDNIGGQVVSSVNAQHPNFRRRYMNQSACATVQYFVGGVTGGFTEDAAEGSGAFPGFGGVAPAGQLFTSCGSVCSGPAAPVLGVSPATVGVGTNATLSWNGTLAAGTGNYEVYRAAGGPFTLLATVPASSAGPFSYTYTAAGPNGPQDFQVHAVPTCNPALFSTSNTATLTVTGCAKSARPPNLIISSPMVPMGSLAGLTWDPPVAGFGGRYTVRFSTDNGATFQDYASGLINNQFTFTVGFPVGSLVIFSVVADPLCGPAGLSDPSPTVSLQVVQTCPRVADPVAQMDRTSAAVGDMWSLHWTSTLPSGLGGVAGVYEIWMSRDGGVSFQLAGTTTNTSFTGGPVPQADAGKSIFLYVLAKPSCGVGGIAVGTSNTVFFSVLPGCEAPQAARNPKISAVSLNGQPVNRPPFPTEPLGLSWDAPLSGPTPAAYKIRVNGDGESTVTGGTSVIAPARGSPDPVTLFVRTVNCSPEKSGPTVQSETVALSITPPGTDFTISPNPVVGQAVTFTDTSSPQATTWLWIFDDGTTDSRQSPTHVFTRAGTHFAALDAINGAGSQTKVKSFFVAAGSAATASRSLETVAFDDSDPVRRRATVTLGAQGSMWLRVRTLEAQDTTLFLRFVGADGALETERRLVVSPGADAIYDLAAWGLQGTFSIELVCDRNFSASIVRSGRPAAKEITR